MQGLLFDSRFRSYVFRTGTGACPYAELAVASCTPFMPLNGLSPCTPFVPFVPFVAKIPSYISPLVSPVSRLLKADRRGLMAQREVCPAFPAIHAC